MGDGGSEQQDGEEEQDGRSLKEWGDAAEDVFADGVEEDSLQGEEGCGGEGSAGEDCGDVGEVVGEDWWGFGEDGEEDDAQAAGSEEYEAEEDCESEHSGEEEVTFVDGEDGEDEDVEEIGEEEVPLVDGCRSHDDEGVHDVEVVVAGLGPEGADERVWREAVVGGVEEERDEQAGEGEGVGDDHDAAGVAVVGGDELVVEEAGEEVADEDLEPAAFAVVGGIARPGRE